MALAVAEQPNTTPILTESHLRKSEYEKAKESKRPRAPAVAITPCSPESQPYYFEEGLRRVAPYHFTYNTWCKERWRGRQILEIFGDEFRDRPVEYYKKSIETGGVQVNGKPVTFDYVVKNGDRVSHTLHRHEPPVSADPIGIVNETEDMIVINKPAGIPVHPAGRYNYNCAVDILRAQQGYGFNPLPCNRLDRLTSGIMFMAKHRAAAERMTEQLTTRTVRKEYVARVRGEFPTEETSCDQPILQISPKLGLNRIRANGKHARTVFERISYHPGRTPDVDPATGRRRDGYSIVFARPLTGRTHQIRVHLQYLGHPIANDPIYANTRVFGADLGKLSSSPTNDDSILERLAKMGKSEVAEAVAWHDEMVDDFNRRKAEKLSGEVCETCGTELYTDPGPQELGIWLHARRYESADGAWGFETALPKWALSPEEQTVDGPVVSEAKVIGDLGKALEETKLDAA